MTMEMFLAGLAVGLVVGGVFFGGLMFARAGSLGRAWWGLAVAQRTGTDPSLQAKIDGLLANPSASVPASPPPAAPVPTPVEKRGPIIPTTPKPTGEPLQLLAILQAESKLIDFLLEDISAASDSQVGVGVREVHKLAQAALKKHLTIEPILPGEYEDRVIVPMGFNPSAIQVVGNVTGEPPFNGKLAYNGLRVKEIKLPTRPEGQDPMILMPAEVEM
jgi:Domain of unknown function (DUF2760)